MKRCDESSRCLFAEAEKQLTALYSYIADAASPDIAARYTEAIVSYCESLRTFPDRGTMRNDVRPGLRITHYKKRTIIAFAVDAEHLSIIGVSYGGQDYETILQDDFEDSAGCLRPPGFPQGVSRG
jgi:plasmid stabilization system protein ParE